MLATDSFNKHSVVDILRLPLGDTDLRQWNALVNRMRSARESVTVGIVGKYVDLADSYKSLNEALTHAGVHTRTEVRIHYLDSERIEAETQKLTHASHKLAEAAYRQSGPTGPTQGAPDASGADDDDVIDAEFRETA